MGAVGVGLMMLLENVFPPIPSELIMPLAGYLAAQGRMSFGAALAAGVAGSLAGAVFWYGIGRAVGEERLRGWIDRHGVWLGLRPSDVDRARRFFHEHGRAGVFFGRLIPVVRTLISVPAGFSRMNVATFLFFTALGTTLWTGALAYAGRLLGAQFPQIERFVGPFSWVVVGAILIAYLVRVVRLRRER